jgi:hypothetical protein
MGKSDGENRLGSGIREWLGAYLDMVERDRTELHVLRQDGHGAVAIMDAGNFVRMRERSHLSQGPRRRPVADDDARA